MFIISDAYSNQRSKDLLLQTKVKDDHLFVSHQRDEMNVNDYVKSSSSVVFHLGIHQPEPLSSSKSSYIHPESIVGAGDQACLSTMNLFSTSPSKILIIGGGFHLDKTMTLNTKAGLFSCIHS
jgi:hypothetical protein